MKKRGERQDERQGGPPNQRQGQRQGQNRGMHACMVELVPGVSMVSLGVGERLALSALRLTSSGAASCGAIERVFDDMLSGNAAPALDGLRTMASLLPCESERTLTLGLPCARGVTWDEAAILALLEAAQRSDAAAIETWFRRLDVRRPSMLLQRGLTWLSAAFAVSSCAFTAQTRDLTTCRPGRPDGDSCVKNCK